MFLENEFARPLFDFEKGGQPLAYLCLKCTDKPKVTRTERGMRRHLKTVHNWTEQPCLYSTDQPTDQRSGEPRQLRAGPPLLSNQSETLKDVEKIQVNQRSVETNEGELQKCTK